MVIVLKHNMHKKFRSYQQYWGCRIRSVQSPLRILLIYMFLLVDKEKTSWNTLFPHFAQNWRSFPSPPPQKAQEAGIQSSCCQSHWRAGSNCDRFKHVPLPFLSELEHVCREPALLLPAQFRAANAALASEQK